MQWDERVEEGNAETRRRLLDESEYGRLTVDLRRRWADRFMTLEVIRAVTELVTYARTSRTNTMRDHDRHSTSRTRGPGECRGLSRDNAGCVTKVMAYGGRLF